jgi:hypothetical protein
MICAISVTWEPEGRELVECDDRVVILCLTSPTATYESRRHYNGRSAFEKEGRLPSFSQGLTLGATVFRQRGKDICHINRSVGAAPFDRQLYHMEQCARFELFDSSDGSSPFTTCYDLLRRKKLYKLFANVMNGTWSCNSRRVQHGSQVPGHTKVPSSISESDRGY